MGWTVMHRPAGVSALDFWNGEIEGPRHRVVDVSERSGRAYLAVETKWQSPDGAETTITFAVIVLTRWQRRHGYYNFAYKDMDEFAGPYRSYDCPARILNRLTPLNRMVEVGFIGQDSSAHQCAAEWRRRTEEHMAARKNGPSLQTGMVVCFEPPLPWNRGEAFSQLLCLDARRHIFAPVDNPSRHLRLRRETIRAALASPANGPNRSGTP